MTTLAESNHKQSRLGLAGDHRTLASLLEAARGRIAATLPKHLTPEKLIRVALVAVSRSTLLQKCTNESVLKCVMVSAQLGLDPSGVLGSAYMVPFWNKKLGAYEATLIPGYRGLIDLARRSNQIASIEARVVYEGETFELEFGLQPRLVHKPELDAGDDQPRRLRLVYAVARFKDPDAQPQIEVMTRAAIDAIRRRSQARDDGPWVTDYEEMARKTVVKRLAKYLPLSVEFQSAVELDDRAQRGEPMPDIVDGMIVDRAPAESEPALPRTSRVKQQIEQRATQTAAPDAGEAEQADAPVEPQESQTEVEVEQQEADPPPPIDDDEATKIKVGELLDGGIEQFKKSLFELARSRHPKITRADLEGGWFKFVLGTGVEQSAIPRQTWVTLWQAVESDRFSWKSGSIRS